MSQSKVRTTCPFDMTPETLTCNRNQSEDPLNGNRKICLAWCRRSLTRAFRAPALKLWWKALFFSRET